jgi:hypothetical protein
MLIPLGSNAWHSLSELHNGSIGVVTTICVLTFLLCKTYGAPKLINNYGGMVSVVPVGCTLILLIGMEGKYNI